MDVFDAVAKLKLDSKDYVQGLNDAMETLKRFEETAAQVFDAVGQSAVNM